MISILRVVKTMNPAAGGIAEGIRCLHPFLNDYNIKTTVCTLDSPDCPWADDLNGDILCFGPSRNAFGFQFGLISRLVSLYADYDCIIIEGLWNYHSYAARTAAKIKNKPFFVFPHGMLDPWFNKDRLRYLKKLVYWLLFERHVISDAELVLYTTQSEKLLAKKSFPFFRDQSFVLGYGIERPLLDQKQKTLFYSTYPSLRCKRILLFLGRVHPKKGLDNLFYSFSESLCTLKDFHIVIAGPSDSSYKSYLQRLADKLNITSSISWVGMLSGDLKWGAFQAAELFCLPSHQENFGVAVVEALSSDLLTCISDQVNISSEIELTSSGIVHGDSIAELSKALLKFSTLSNHESRKMRLNAMKLFDEQYNVSIIARNLRQCISSRIN